MARPVVALALALVSFGCGDRSAERPGHAHDHAAPAEGAGATPEGASAAPDAPPPTGREVVRFDLVRHVARAERYEGETLVVDFGTSEAAKYTLGGWRTRVGDDVELDDATVTLIPGVIGELAVPARSEGAHQLLLRARAFGDGRVTLYVGDDAVAYPQLPRDGSFATIRATIPAGKLAAGENVLQLRVGGRGRATTGAGASVQAGLALDWLRLGPEGDAGLVDRAPPPSATADALVLPQGVRAEFAIDAPPGSFLLAEVDGTVRVRALRERAPAIDLGTASGALRVDLAPTVGELTRLELVATGEGAEVARVRGARIATFDAPAAPALAASAPRVANVLIYLVDTVRADRLRPWNPETRVQTPGLDRWVQTAAVFERGYTPENWTKPSVASLLTGLLPWQHTATSGEAVLPRSVEMLSETLSGAGFHTGAFVANGYVSDKFGFQQGWRTWRNYIREGRRSAATFVAADVLEWLDARPTDKPFFLYVHTIDPHVPYIPPEETLALYDAEPYHGPVDFTADRGLLEKVKSGRLRLGARDRQRLEALYDGEITYHDTHFASILDGLARRGLRDDTLVVFTADHGEEFFDHDSVGHGHSLYEELLHVPFVVRIPGVESPVRVEEPVNLVDVVPTVLDALGREVPAELPGRSLLPLLRGELSDAPRVSVSGFMDGWRAIVVGRHKLIQRTHRRFMLFDLVADPGETTDLAADRPHTVRHLRGLLGLALRGATGGRHRRETTAIDAETDAQLRALGYLGTQRPQ